MSEGAGIELIQLIRKAFSVLNRLLLLRQFTEKGSPVEHCLSAQPANLSHRHVVATIAQYMYHRHDARLPRLATLLLKRLGRYNVDIYIPPPPHLIIMFVIVYSIIIKVLS